MGICTTFVIQLKTNIMTATVKTKSNFSNANGHALKVIAFLGKIVSLEVPQYGFDEQGKPQGKMITADFQLSEIVSINQ
jgi:hypothetical protein